MRKGYHTIRSITVRLYFGCRWTHEARRARIELVSPLAWSSSLQDVKCSGLTPPDLQVPTSYESPYTYVGLPCRITALIWVMAPADMGMAVDVTPWLGSPPPQKALSKISAPCSIGSAFCHVWKAIGIVLPESIPRGQAVWSDTWCRRRSQHWQPLPFLAGQSWNSSHCRTMTDRHRQGTQLPPPSSQNRHSVWS